MRRRLSARYSATLLVSLAFTFVLVLSGCSASHSFPPQNRTEPPSFPAYPNVLGVRESHDAIVHGNIDRHITFGTNDTPEAVISFYEAQLKREGWIDPITVLWTELNMKNQVACPSTICICG